VVVPARLLLPQHFRHLDKAGEVQGLAVRGGDPLSQDTRVADPRSFVGHVLQEAQLIGMMMVGCTAKKPALKSRVEISQITFDLKTLFNIQDTKTMVW